MFPGKELRDQSPNSYILVSVSDLYIPLVGLPSLLLENRWAERGILKYRSLPDTWMWIVEIGTEAAQFLFWEYIKSNFFAVHGSYKCDMYACTVIPFRLTWFEAPAWV